MSMQITFHGAADVVTGSCFLVKTANRQILVDCGMFQGSKALANRNYDPFPFTPEAIDAVLLTHAHIDHSGLLPKLVRSGFTGPIYTTSPTADLLEIMLPDSAYIQESEVEQLNRRRARKGEPPLTPIYTQAHAEKTLTLIKRVDMHRPFTLWEETEVTFTPAGHVLGAACITLTHQDGDQGDTVTVAFSGDLGAGAQTLLSAPEPLTGAHIVIMESTYGDRARLRDESRYEKLGQIVQETFARKGNVVIPAFAVGRTQEVLYGLHRLIRSGDLDPGQIFLDSPLASRATDIFCEHINSFDEEARHFAQATEECPLYLRDLSFARTPEESMAINRIKSGAVIISASGMCEAGRIKHHLRHNLWRPECSVVFVGYQAEGTLGSRIQRGDERVRIHGDEVKVRAHIHTLEGFSAHADQDELLQWAGQLTPTPRQVYLVHGEDGARSALKARLEGELGLRVGTPLIGETVECTPSRVTRVAPGAVNEVVQDPSALWQTLLELRQTLDVIERQGITEGERAAIEQELKGVLSLLQSVAGRTSR